MFGLSYSEFVQGSALRTWNCVAHFASLLWYKFNHLKDPIMPRSRRRHHSRSRSRSRSHSHERDREPKRRKIESYDSPQHRRSVSSQPEANDSNVGDRGIDETDTRKAVDLSPPKSSSTAKSDKVAINDVEESKNKDGVKNTSRSTPDGNKKSKSDLQSAKDTEVIDLDSEEDEVTSDSDSKIKESVKELETSDDGEIEESNPDNEAKVDSVKNNTPSKLKDKNNDLKITPNKVLSPKQLQKRLESEKKRQERQKEKEEREQKRLEEKEEKERKRLEEKKRLNEEKLRLKQEKDEQKMKEKLAKEEKKKKEQEEKDKKRREKEEKDEQKKKEREQEKLKKQQEIDEKNKEKQKLEEQKQKTAAAFVNFFVPKKSESEEKKLEESSIFMPFEIKSDMRLAPIIRKTLTDDVKTRFDECLEKQEGIKSYLDELKDGKQTGKSEKTWPFEDDRDDVIFIEECVGESIVEQKSKLEKMRAKFFKFHENQRPPYFGTFKKKSKNVAPRKPFGKDTIFNYEIDSDEEWEEEGEGESLKGTDDEDEKDNEPDNDYEVDNDVFVPHGHLSDDEVDDEVNAKLSPESHKLKLKVLKREFDEEMKSKTQKIKPRVIGCIWYNKTKSNVEEAIDRYLQPFSIICVGQIEIKKRSDFAFSSVRKVPKQLSKEHVPLFLKLIHGSVDKGRNIVSSFMEHMSNNGIQLEVSKFSLGKQLKNFAQWKKCPEEGVLHNKMCWYVGEDIRKEYNVDLTLPSKISSKRAKAK